MKLGKKLHVEITESIEVFTHLLWELQKYQRFIDKWDPNMDIEWDDLLDNFLLFEIDSLQVKKPFIIDIERDGFR